MTSALSNLSVQTVDFDKAYKLPKQARYFNISVLWIFYYPLLLRLLYYTKIRHEVVTLVSFLFGVLAGLLLLREGYLALLLATLCIHLKDVFDACDGSLARLRNQTNRIARFLDSLCDFLAINWIVVALAIRLYPSFGSPVIGLALGTLVSLFIQCSYFNYYLIAYTKIHGDTNVRHDERLTESDKKFYAASWKRFLLIFLQNVYRVTYGWQDKLVGFIDGGSVKTVYGKARDSLAGGECSAWYGDKTLLTLNTPLCFGTHLFILILSMLLSHPEFFYYIVLIPGNGYLLFNYAYRQRRFARRIAREGFAG